MDRHDRAKAALLLTSAIAISLALSALAVHLGMNIIFSVHS